MSDIARDLRAAAFVLLECPEHAETVDGGVLVNLHKRADELNAAAAEIERLRLTAEEREALIVASIELNALGMFETNHSAALRALLERLA